jgi:hypothetical protein
MRPETLLLRQIHPNFVQQGRVTSQAFRPTPKDEHQLSVDNGDRIDAQSSWRRFTSNSLCTSAGVMAVSNGECAAQQLQVVEDAFPYPEHCSVDFSPHGKSAVEKTAKQLSHLARVRGWLFQADLPT